jgi:hypothetical protein
VLAAGNLLSAYDPRRKESLDFGKHNISDNDMVKLIQALEAIINRQTPYNTNKSGKAAVTTGTGILKAPQEKVDEKKAAAPKPSAKVDPKAAPKADVKPADPKAAEGKPAGKLDASATPTDTLDADQAAVVRFIRRNAIRALAQVRYPTFSLPNGTTVRPEFTLARIAVNDGPFYPALAPDEYAEAVMGLANLTNVQGIDIDGTLTCIAIGTTNFARRKVANLADNSIAWRAYGARLNQTFADWQKALAVNTAFAAAGTKVADLAGRLSANVFTPMEKLDRNNPGTVTIALETVQQWISSRPAGNGLTVYSDLKPDQRDKFKLKPVLAGN